METYKNIDEFIEQTFPGEYQKIIKQKKSVSTIRIEEADAEFDEKLKKIINGEDAEKDAAEA